MYRNAGCKVTQWSACDLLTTFWLIPPLCRAYNLPLALNPSSRPCPQQPSPKEALAAPCAHINDVEERNAESPEEESEDKKKLSSEARNGSEKRRKRLRNRWWWREARSEPLYMTAVTTVNTIGPKIGKESVVYVPPLERELSPSNQPGAAHRRNRESTLHRSTVTCGCPGHSRLNPRRSPRRPKTRVCARRIGVRKWNKEMSVKSQ
ncbi:hypothetical protein FB451DRAFT_1368791 [Mycena latifolia]|nr:hypothetical protein FB451DRAFT_1368791 [Mycena latifolia]